MQMRNRKQTFHCQAQGQTTAGFAFQCPTNYDTSQSKKVGLASALTPLPAPLNHQPLSSYPLIHSPEERVVLNADLPQPLG